MNERRTPAFTFTSEEDLITFFSQTVARKKLKSIIARLKKNFVHRPEDSADENHLNFLKKCEYEIIRFVKEQESAQKT